MDTSTLQVLLARGADTNHSTNVRQALIRAGVLAPGCRLISSSIILVQAGDTALLLAAGDGLMKHVQLLLQHGADVYARDGTGRTALELAAARGYADIAQILITAAPDLIGIAGVRYVTRGIRSALGVTSVTRLCFFLFIMIIVIGKSLEWCDPP